MHREPPTPGQATPDGSGVPVLWAAEAEAKAGMSLDEQWAGELLTLMLGADSWVPRDVKGTSGMHDLDLVFSDGSRFAIEVTTHTAPNRAAFHAELRKSAVISAPTLKIGWIVEIDMPQSEADNAKAIRPLFARIKPELESILAQAAEEELHEIVHCISPIPTGPGGHPICSRLRSLRVTRAFSAGWQRAGHIYLNQAGRAFSSKPDDCTDAIEFHISRKRSKLITAKQNGADEAHLFLWIPDGATRSDAAHLAARKLWDGAEPPRRTSLQDLDSIWIAARGFPGKYCELHGYAFPIWQFNHRGWHRWDRMWRQEPL